MKLNIFAALVFVVAFAGCDFTAVSVDMGQRLQSPVVEGVAAAVDNATGGLVTESQKDTAVKVTGAVSTGAKVVGTVAALVPGGQGVAAIAMGISTLVAGIGAFMQKRKTRAVMIAAINAADKVPGGGATLVESAKEVGVDKLIESVYTRAN